MKRSVLKYIKTHRDETVLGAGIGRDCAILAFEDGYETVLSTTPVTAEAEDLAGYALNMAINNLVLQGAEPVGIMLSILLPESSQESELQKIMKAAEAFCKTNHMEIIGGHTEITPIINKPLINVTGVGKREKSKENVLKNIEANCDIVISKWIGLEGTVRIAKEHRAELCSRYPEYLIDEAIAFDRYLSIVPEAATAMKSGVCGMHDVSRGGIFGALWEMASGAGVGLEIDLKRLPIRQETIEICEFFGINPYELLSGGCLIMITKDGEKLVHELEREQIPAVIVGRTTDGNDRVIYNEEEKRFLDMPKMDQIYQV